MRERYGITIGKQPGLPALALTLALTLGAPGLTAGQDLDNTTETAPAGLSAPRPTLQAHRLTTPPTLDGLLTEPDWGAARIATSFTVFEPNEGATPAQRTEARVLFGDEAIYIGIRAFDTAPDSIVTRLARRDERAHSDWVDVVIDSYHDRRTAFRFGVNPAGVKVDAYMYDDTEEDDSWDAVWDVATHTDERGWTAEFRIPYSQLRFDGAAQQTWGINFARFIARHLEMSLWAPISRGDGALVSRFGDLEGLRDLSPPTRLEVMPYSVVRMERSPGTADDPFHDPHDYSSTVGADLKYGLTTDLTLDVAINPDFGQVEADPAQVNLTAFETFFPERRPFFVEGSGIFQFRFSEGDGDMAREGLFYSRRIGRPPQGRIHGAAYRESPEGTRILGAMKLSGKTRSGWSLGLLHAVTGQEKGRLADRAGTVSEQVVEPAAQYGMARIGRDFREGRSAVGMISTWTRRAQGPATELALHQGAYTGGIDARHRFGGDRFIVTGYLLGSTVHGSKAAIARTQRAPARYYQRPDGDHTTYDPTRTSLSGWAGAATLAKISGGYWRFATGAMARSPGFDSNDLGFMREADFVVPFAWVGYQHFRPAGYFQNWSVGVDSWAPYSFGGEGYQKGFNLNGNFTLNNFWGGFAGVMRRSTGLSYAALRGGPMLRQDPSWGGWFGFWSDSRKQLRLEVQNNWQLNPAKDSWSYGSRASMRWRPSSRATLSAGPFVNRREEDLQWVGRFDIPSPEYIFAELGQTTAGLTTRVDWTFSPTLSLQAYAEPFVSAGDYGNLRRITDPRAAAYADRFDHVEAVAGDDGTINIDVDGDGTPETFPNPDFNFKQFRSNVVLRWEYRPGSVLFAVWSQGRDHFAQTGEFSMGDDLGALFRQPGEDVLMVKLNYWVG
ncbi:MAG: DUF5916 domain-containing protein [Gemmatimonadota bacterium]|nr:DUF5916 domain-containing protein [Gemmatimonadota bacterium]MDE2985352.1 DUF5916 domain-containing protein [Gemmatimonadota bacterium]